jgi:hypothetical protein
VTIIIFLFFLVEVVSHELALDFSAFSSSGYRARYENDTHKIYRLNAQNIEREREIVYSNDEESHLKIIIHLIFAVSGGTFFRRQLLFWVFSCIVFFF